MQPMTLAVQNALPPKDMGVATASATFFRQMGGTLGTAVFLSILFSACSRTSLTRSGRPPGPPEFRAALSDPAVLADPANRAVITALGGNGLTPAGTGVLEDSSFLTVIDARLARPFLEGFAGVDERGVPGRCGGLGAGLGRGHHDARDTAAAAVRYRGPARGG